MHLNAALALSELGKVSTKADIGTQTIDSGKSKRSSQTIPTQTPSSTSTSPIRRSAETQTKRRSKKSKKVLVAEEEDNQTLDLCQDLLSQDRPLWGVMSTQTSPTYSKFSVSTMTPYDDIEPTASTSTAGDERKKFAMGQSQLSTETQTGDDDVQLWRDDYWNPLSTTEAETQFDLDDILRSNYTENYTQTGILQQTTAEGQVQTDICPDDFNI